VIGRQDALEYRFSTLSSLVTIAGPLADLDRLDPASFTVPLDVTGLQPGVHEVTPVPNLQAGLRLLTIAAATVAALAWAGTASALIVPQKSIAGIALDMTRTQVRAQAGNPNRVVHGTNEFGVYTVFRYRRLKVTFQGNAGATDVFTTRFHQETAEGIHVGSTETALHAAYPGAHCHTDFGFRHCWTGRFRPGHKVTDYRIGLSTHRIKSVSVGYVID
jgi:hypothetical protein